MSTWDCEGERGERDSTAVADDRRDDGVAIAEALARLEVSRVQIL